MPNALALISGSLDSEVAATVVKQTGVELTCAVFECPFQHRTNVTETAARLESPLLTLEPDATFLDVVRRPRFNFGGGPLSCLECRLRMLQAGNEKRLELGADLLVTGEVLGQRAANQSRRQIDLLTYHSGAKDVLLRPLSSKILGTPEKPSEVAISTASFSISGSGRRPIKALARKLGIADIDRPGPQCRLTDPGYMARLDDLLVNQAEVDLTDISLLLLGRHYRVSRATKAIVGRNQSDNDAIEKWYWRHSRGQLFVPLNFQGPTVLMMGGNPSEVEAGLSLAASRKSVPSPGGFEFLHQGATTRLTMLCDTATLQPIRSQ